ncbi:GNAT family N-acetyltransferase [Rubrimonas cliftonensis]|uniref:Protein N-acetyltransferase, RimJ/RimL family n=1 Tax=Rubrimonas cliftonensis TaxID=89524 RepID=A0A1H3Z9X6_9RHOB|nr:GNAT family N-acetyltransferase [Rubrimonas cliftonensis]SEA20435.1 Protein N-acetyltransferase, RimJ/RimL family [Rubrimonas cliftonensis]
MRDRIETPRLTLRRLRGDDAGALSALADDAGVARMLTRMPHPCPPEATAAYIRGCEGEPWVYCVTLAEAPIGAVAVEARLGYWIGRPYWGRGYAFEAASALVDAWFTASDTPLETGVFADNPASRRILARLGFRETGRRLQASLGRPEPDDYITMRLDGDDWRAARRIDRAEQEE